MKLHEFQMKIQEERRKPAGHDEAVERLEHARRQVANIDEQLGRIRTDYDWRRRAERARQHYVDQCEELEAFVAQCDKRVERSERKESPRLAPPIEDSQEPGGIGEDLEVGSASELIRQITSMSDSDLAEAEIHWRAQNMKWGALLTEFNRTGANKHAPRRFAEAVSKRQWARNAITAISDEKSRRFRQPGLQQHADAESASAKAVAAELASRLDEAQRKLDELKDAALAVEFMEAAREIFAEATFGKILARARSKMAAKRRSESFVPKPEPKRELLEDKIERLALNVGESIDARSSAVRALGIEVAKVDAALVPMYVEKIKRAFTMPSDSAVVALLREGARGKLL